MASSHRILVLEFEEPPEVIREAHGTHGDLLVHFVFGDAKSCPPIEIKKHRVLASQKYPHLSEISAIMITGSSEAPVHVTGRGALMSSTEYSAVKNDPWIPSLLDYVKQAYQAKIPIAGFCYGHQIIARALGGHVALSPGGYELGVQEVMPSSQGVDILGTETLVLPVAPFHACSLTDPSQNIPQFHSDCVSSLPPNVDNHASSSLCEVQVMYQKGRVLGYQGHPEFDSYVTRCLADLLLEHGGISQELFDSQIKGGSEPKGAGVLSKLAREFLLRLD